MQDLQAGQHSCVSLNNQAEEGVFPLQTNFPTLVRVEWCVCGVPETRRGSLPAPPWH